MGKKKSKNDKADLAKKQFLERKKIIIEIQKLSGQVNNGVQTF